MPLLSVSAGIVIVFSSHVLAELIAYVEVNCLAVESALKIFIRDFFYNVANLQHKNPLKAIVFDEKIKKFIYSIKGFIIY